MEISTTPAVAPDPLVRRSVEADLDTLYPACVAMYTEEVGVSPELGGGADLYRARVAQLVAKGWSFSRIEDGQVVFKAEVAAASPYACQVQGVYVAPDRRGEGLAAAGHGGRRRRTRCATSRRWSRSTSTSTTSRPVAAYDRVGFRADRHLHHGHVLTSEPARYRPAMDKDIAALAGIFATSGVIHLAKPEVYEPIMPKAVPSHREVIYASGVLELACAAGLLQLPHPLARRLGERRAAARASTPPTSRWPLDASRSGEPGLQAVAYGRLPLQLPMIWSAYKAARR